MIWDIHKDSEAETQKSLETEKVHSLPEMGECPSSWSSGRAEPLSRGFKDGEVVRIFGGGGMALQGERKGHGDCDKF